MVEIGAKVTVNAGTGNDYVNNSGGNTKINADTGDGNSEVAQGSISEMLALLLPFIIFLMALVDTFVNYWATVKVLRRLPGKDGRSTAYQSGNGGDFMTKLPPFSEWRFPKILLYLFALALVGVYWGTTRDIKLLYQISLNVYFFTVMAGLLQGIALLTFAAHRFGVGKFWLILAVAVIFFSGLLTMVLAFTGLFDMYFDYRRRFTGGSAQ